MGGCKVVMMECGNTGGGEDGGGGEGGEKQQQQKGREEEEKGRKEGIKGTTKEGRKGKWYMP